jgi:FG-GAP repeat protein
MPRKGPLATGDADGDGELELYCGAPTDTEGFADSGQVFVATF